MTWTLKTAPPEEPVSLSEIKDHLRIEHSDHDTMLEGLIRASREYVEQVTARAIIEQTRVAYFKDWPAVIFELPGSPLQSVTEVRYTNTDGTTNTFSSDNYAVVTATEPGRIVLGYSQTWPSDVLNHASYPVEVEFVAGYKADETQSPTDYRANVPEAIQNAICLDVELRYDRPPESYQERIKSVIESLLAPYRVWSF